MPRRPEGPPPDPPVQRLRLHYAKRGRLRFSSHRDFQRAFERALRRAGDPHRVQRRLHPAPQGLVRRRGADRCRQRGGVPGDRADAGARPGRRRGPPWTSPCPRSGRRGGGDGRRGHLAAGPPGGLGVRDPARRGSTRRRPRRRSARCWPPGRCEIQRMTKNGMRRFDARGPVERADVRLGACRGSPGRQAVLRVRYCEWSSGTPRRLSALMTSSRRCVRWPTSRRRSHPR